MIKTAVTVSLVEAARGGPFVLWDDLEKSCSLAAEAGFDAIELFAPTAGAIPVDQLRALLGRHRLGLAAVGTGAGWVLHRLSLCDPDPSRRARAIAFIRDLIHYGGALGAPAIIGSMQGRWGETVDRDQALTWLGNALEELGAHAAEFNLPLLYEPLNRYETNLCNTLEAGMKLLQPLAATNVLLLADLFHLNIEEKNPTGAIRAAGRAIGHVHFVDSNRHPPGMGHLNLDEMAEALKEIGYEGYVSAECLPYPDSPTAARHCAKAYGRWFATS